jgi:hypothetical protein
MRDDTRAKHVRTEFKDLMMPNTLMHAIAILWVGGFGFFFVAFPDQACRIFGIENTTLQTRKVIRIFGASALGSALIAFGYALWVFRP